MFADQFNRVSRYDVLHRDDSHKSDLYLERAPFYIITNFLDLMPDGVGDQVAKNVFLINPLLGCPSPRTFVYRLCKNQLEWIAYTWKYLCSEGSKSFGEAMAVTPLLISGEWGMFIINEKGQIHQVQM